MASGAAKHPLPSIILSELLKSLDNHKNIWEIFPKFKLFPIKIILQLLEDHLS
jgi:hypothetical protein